jgi:hypothetical protein
MALASATASMPQICCLTSMLDLLIRFEVVHSLSGDLVNESAVSIEQVMAVC